MKKMEITIEVIRKMISDHKECFLDPDCDLLKEYPGMVLFLLDRVELFEASEAKARKDERWVSAEKDLLESKLKKEIRDLELRFQAARNVANFLLWSDTINHFLSDCDKSITECERKHDHKQEVLDREIEAEFQRLKGIS